MEDGFTITYPINSYHKGAMFIPDTTLCDKAGQLRKKG
jgi:hypothetical protein